MDLVGRAKRVRIYLSEGDKIGHELAPVAIVELLRRENCEGATVLRGTAGFGATGEIHVSHLVDVVQDLPVVVEWIDSAQQVERVLPRIKELLPRGLITMDDTEVVLHQPHRVRELPTTLTARDVMSRDVTTVGRGTSLREVVELMLGQEHRALPVVEEGAPVGIITSGDLVQRGGLAVRIDLLESLEHPEIEAILERVAAANRTAGEIMTSSPVVVATTATLPQVAEAMARRRLKRLPVIDERGLLVGVVSRVDLLRTVAGGYQHDQARPRTPGFSGGLPLSRIMRLDFPMVYPDTALADVFQAVISTRLNRALVVDPERRVLGVITDAELIERIAPAHRPSALRSLMHRLPFAHPKGETTAEQHASARCAADLMRADVPTATEDTRVRDAIARMLQGNHKLLAVTDPAGRLVGVVDRADLLHGLVTPT